MSRKYWINQDGHQSGPHTLEDLQSMTFGKNTYVWFSGMPDWKRLDAVPELSHLLPIPEPVEPEAEPVEPEIPAVETPELEVPVEETPEEESPELEEVSTPTPPAYEEPATPTPPAYEGPSAPTPPPYVAPRNAAPQAAAQAATAEAAPAECPPTNLVWAIICTILCCTPFGIAGIVLAILTKSKFNQGDYVKAQKYSEWGAWLCILSVVFCILMMPISFLMVH